MLLFQLVMVIYSQFQLFNTKVIIFRKENLKLKKRKKNTRGYSSPSY